MHHIDVPQWNIANSTPRFASEQSSANLIREKTISFILLPSTNSGSWLLTKPSLNLLHISQLFHIRLKANDMTKHRFQLNSFLWFSSRVRITLYFSIHSCKAFLKIFSKRHQKFTKTEKQKTCVEMNVIVAVELNSYGCHCEQIAKGCFPIIRPTEKKSI